MKGDGHKAVARVKAPWKNEYPWWLETLAGVGTAAIIGGILSLFFAVGRRPEKLWVTEAPPVESRDFLVSLSGTVDAPLRTGGTVELLNNGTGFFPSLLEAIRGARHTVNVSCYIWEEGQVADQVLAALEERARAGVEVRVLLDGMGASQAPEMDALKSAGGKVVTFRPARFGKLMRFHKRNHRRAIVMDGRVGFTGGSAMADKWLGDADSKEHWRDTMVRVTGPMALTLQSAFADAWGFASGEILQGPRFFPPEVETGPDAAGTLIHTGLASTPASDTHPLRLFLAQCFLSAREKLYITTPYFVPDRQTREAVAERARAGVDVRILMPDEHTDAKMIRLTSHHYYDELLSAGVRIYEYKRTMMHAKHIVVDGKWSVVGSANMDVRSVELNLENVIGILDEDFARTLEVTFEEDLKHAREFHLEEWRKRGTWERVKERLASLLAEQY
jgi:cardiolipin synthase